MPEQLDQGHLCEQIIKFNRIDARLGLNQKASASKRDHRHHHEREIREGCCHGFAVTDSYMHAVNGYGWWHALKVELSRWDGTIKSLFKKVSLPGSKSRYPVTLYRLFRRASSYILQSQHSFGVSLGFSEQPEIFDPDNPYFFVVEGPFVAAKNLSVNFSKNDLAILLDSHQSLFSQHMICLISYSDHACSFAFKQGKWFFRDPNDENGYKTFKSTREFVDYLMRAPATYGAEKQAISIAIRLATWDTSKQSLLNSFVKKYNEISKRYPPIVLLRNLGAQLLIRYDIERFVMLVKAVVASKNDSQITETALLFSDLDTFRLFSIVEACENEVGALHCFLTLASYHQTFCEKFYVAFERRVRLQCSTVDTLLLDHSIEHVRLMLHHAKSDKNAAKMIKDKLNMTNVRGPGSMLRLLKQDILLLDDLISWAKSDVVCSEQFLIFFKYLCANESQMMHDYFYQISAATVEKLIALAKRSESSKSHLLKGLFKMKGGSKPPILSIIVKYPEQMKKILSLKGTSDTCCIVDLTRGHVDFYNDLVCYVLAPIGNGIGLHTLAEHAPQMVVDLFILSCSLKDKALHRAFLQGLEKADTTKTTPKKMLEKRLGPQAVAVAFRHSNRLLDQSTQKRKSQATLMWKTVPVKGRETAKSFQAKNPRFC